LEGYRHPSVIAMRHLPNHYTIQTFRDGVPHKTKAYANAKHARSPKNFHLNNSLKKPY
jgi:hypothetical protein